MGPAMRAKLVALIALVVLRAELPRARADEDAAITILIHPRVVTTLQLPDEIVHTWIDHHGETRVARIRDKLYIRPRPGTPAGLEASLEVETLTARWTFRLRVVARASDASREIRVVPVEAQAPEESTPVVPPGVLAEPVTPLVELTGPVTPPLAVTPEAEPAADAPTSEANAPPPEPIAGAETAESSAERDTAAGMARDTATAGAPRFDLSAHAVIGLGVTALDFAGYQPNTGFQPHYALGIRLAGEPPGGWWALEVELSAESLAGPLTYSKTPAPDLEVSGPRLRGMLGMRVQGGIRWMPSVYAGIGAHAHLRETKGSPWLEGAPSSTMKHGGVLALGMGLQYRTRDISLGFDVQVRFGSLDEYRSIAAFLTVGRVLYQGE